MDGDDDAFIDGNMANDTLVVNGLGDVDTITSDIGVAALIMLNIIQ